MRYQDHEWIGTGLRMADLKCRCSDPLCKWKELSELKHRRSVLFLRNVGFLLKEHDGHVKVTSGFRCPTHNQTIGGAPNSAHIHRVAIDLQPDEPVYRLALLAEASGFFSGIIVYVDTNVLHLDVHTLDRVVRGYVLGGKYHLLPYGRREGSGLVPLFEWNEDETDTPPDYILQAGYRETTI